MKYIHKICQNTNNINGDKMSRKINILNIITYLTFFIIITRIFYLQIVKNDYYLNKIDELNDKEILGDTMPRGKIFDRNGILLVDNILVKTIYYKKVDGIGQKMSKTH